MITEERRDELMNGVHLTRAEKAEVIDGALVIYDVNDPPGFMQAGQPSSEDAPRLTEIFAEAQGRHRNRVLQDAAWLFMDKLDRIESKLDD